MLNCLMNSYRRYSYSICERWRGRTVSIWFFFLRIIYDDHFNLLSPTFIFRTLFMREWVCAVLFNAYGSFHKHTTYGLLSVKKDLSHKCFRRYIFPAFVHNNSPYFGFYSKPVYNTNVWCELEYKVLFIDFFSTRIYSISIIININVIYLIYF